MTFTYTEEESVIVRTDKNGNQWFIPKDPANSDYQRYLNPDDESGTL
jgi:hypothetical protein